MNLKSNCRQQRHALLRNLALTILTVVLVGCDNPQSARSQARRSNTTASEESNSSKPSIGTASQQYFSLQQPAAVEEAVVTARVKGWQQDCDSGRYAYLQPQQSQFRIYGQGMSVFTLKRTSNGFVASSDIPAANGKTSSKGTLIQLRTLSLSGEPLTSTVLSGTVWTPRASVIGRLDLTGSGKITTSPNFSFDAFKNSPEVIPFANGYAVNLFGQKVHEGGLVDTNVSPEGNYLSDNGKPIYGRLVRSRFGRLEEVILATSARQEIIFPDFKPTLSGHKNNAFVQTDKVGADEKEMVVFWRKDLPEYVLVTALGGVFWGGGFQIGANGEKKCIGEAHVAIDGETQFTGNLDYDGSTYTFLGKVSLLEHTFESSENDPLVLRLVKDKGFVYVRGKGTVTKPDGDKTDLSALKSNMETVVSSQVVQDRMRYDVVERLEMFTEAIPYYNRGKELYEKGDLDGAIGQYNKAIEIYPLHAEAYSNLAVALRAKGNLEGCIQHLQKALEINPRDAIAYYNLGNALLSKGDLDGAIRQYRNAIAIDPNMAEAYGNLGLAQYNKQDLAGATSSLSKSIKLNPRYAEAHANMGLVLSAKGDLKAAIQAFQKTIDLEPQNAFAHYCLGTALADVGNLSAAIRQLKKTIEIDSNMGSAYNNLVGIYHLQKDYDNAWVVIQQARRQGLGQAIHPKLLEEIKRASGREE
jgi:tetratricopeptide (TPR) repeat protein